MPRQLSSVDASFLYMETPEMPMHVGSMAIFRPPQNDDGNFFETFKALIVGRLHIAPILKSKLVRTPGDIDHPSWIEDDQFDIDRHIFRAALPAPANRATLQRIVGWMHAKLLNRERPLWEFYVFEGLAGGEIGLYSKMHHACIDGGAGAALTQIIYDVTPTPRQVDPRKPQAQAANEVRDVAGSMVDSYVRMWREPLGAASGLASIQLPRSGKGDLGSILFDHAMGQIESSMRLMSGLPSIDKTMKELIGRILDPKARESLAGMVAPATPLNKAISSERSYAAVSIPLSRTKTLAKAAGAKLNDVVLALCSGILRRHLLDQGALPQRALTAAVPISLREAGNADANNQVFSMVCPIATNIADPRERLATIVTESSNAKEMTNPLRPLVPHLSSVSMLGAPMLIQVLALMYSRSNLSDVLPPPANVTVSNVPGPRQTLYAAGAELLHAFPVSIAVHGLALNITVQSYCDHLDFGLIAGANVVPDVQKLTDMIPEELEALETAFGIEPSGAEADAAVEASAKSNREATAAPEGEALQSPLPQAEASEPAPSHKAAKKAAKAAAARSSGPKPAGAKPGQPAI